MFIVRILFMLLLYIFPCNLFPQKQNQENIPQSIIDILVLPEHKIDLGIACLLITKEICSDVEIDYFNKQLDIMAKQVSFLVNGKTDPLIRISALNTYLFQKGWWNDSLIFTYDLNDLNAKKVSNQFLTGYLNTRSGSCITMPMLYLVLADRLGWPIHAVTSPGHIFCRYIDKNFKENNIETTCGGGYIPDERYISDNNIPEKALKNGVYLRTLTKKEYLGMMLETCARYRHEHGHDLPGAIYYTTLAVKYDSTYSAGHWNLYKHYLAMADSLKQKEAYLLALRHNRYEAQLMVLRNQSIQRKNTNPRVGFEKEIMNPFITPAPKPLKTNILTSFDNHFNAPVSKRPNLKLQNAINRLQMEFEMENDRLKANYTAMIKETYFRAQWHRNKVDELGIVLKLPDEFYIRQRKSIEKFKKTGKY